MASSAVVEDLDVFADRVRKLDAGLPFLAIEQRDPDRRAIQTARARAASRPGADEPGPPRSLTQQRCDGRSDNLQVEELRALREDSLQRDDERDA